MCSRSGIISFALIFVLAASAWAADEKPIKGASIQGTLIGENGKPFAGAEIQAQRVDAKAKVVLARTDVRGRYFFVGLPVGNYSVTASVDGMAMQRASVRTQNNGWAKVDFDLRLNAKGADGTDRMQRDLHTINATDIGR